MACPRRRGGVGTEVLDDEILLIHPQSGQAYRLNGTARVIWESLDAAGTTHDLAQGLAAVYDVDAVTALEDVEQVLVNLAEAGLLTVEERA